MALIQFAAGAVLAGFLTTASAGTVTLPLMNPITIEYNGPIYSTGASTSSCPYIIPGDCQTATFYGSQWFDDSFTLSYTLSAPNDIKGFLYFNGKPQWDQDPHNLQLRFSNKSLITARMTVTDLENGVVVVDKMHLFDEFTQLYLSNVGSNELQVDLEFELTPGNYVTPSLDPACAAIACMTPGHDIARLYNFSIAAPVPEAESAAMLLAGLGLLTFVRRSRKHAVLPQKTVPVDLKNQLG